MVEEMANEDADLKNKKTKVYKTNYTEEERAILNEKQRKWKHNNLREAQKAAHEAIENGEDVWFTKTKRSDPHQMLRASEIKDWGLSSSIVNYDLKKGTPGYYVDKIL